MSLPKITMIPFPDNQYIKEVYPKRQIILHHTVGWDNARGMYEWWASTPERVATCIGITDNGDCIQGFSSRYWAYHIGLGKPNLEKQSIGIEICNWGGLILDSQGRFKSRFNAIVPEGKVIYYPDGYRGYLYYERYTDAEIESVRRLLIFWGNVYDIPLGYHDNMFEICPEAINGQPGIWSHTSFRPDKSDIHPQLELIQMLQGL